MLICVNVVQVCDARDDDTCPGYIPGVAMLVSPLKCLYFTVFKKNNNSPKSRHY